MIVRFKTNVDVEVMLNKLQESLQVSTKAAIIRLAIAYSVNMEGDPRLVNGVVKEFNAHSQNGAEYNRFTIFGNDETVYKTLMAKNLGRQITDEEFFPALTNAHLERGIKELNADFRLARNKDRFLLQLLNRK